MPSRNLWIGAVAVLCCVFIVVTIWGFFVIIKECAREYRKRRNYVIAPTQDLDGEVLKDTELFDDETENEYEISTDNFYQSVDTSSDEVCFADEIYPYGIEAVVQPVLKDSDISRVTSPIYTPKTLPNLHRDLTKKIIKKRCFKGELLSDATMVLEMSLHEKSNCLLGLIKYLNIPQIQSKEYPTEVCFRFTKLPILHKKQMIFKTEWKKYTSSLMMLSFQMSQLKPSDSMRIRMYGKYKRGFGKKSQEVCHGECVVEMKDLTSEMVLYTHGFLPKGTTILWDDNNIVDSGYSSQCSTPPEY